MEPLPEPTPVIRTLEPTFTAPKSDVTQTVERVTLPTEVERDNPALASDVESIPEPAAERLEPTPEGLKPGRTGVEAEAEAAPQTTTQRDSVVRPLVVPTQEFTGVGGVEKSAPVVPSLIAGAETLQVEASEVSGNREGQLRLAWAVGGVAAAILLGLLLAIGSRIRRWRRSQG